MPDLYVDVIFEAPSLGGAGSAFDAIASCAASMPRKPANSLRGHGIIAAEQIRKVGPPTV